MLTQNNFDMIAAIVRNDVNLAKKAALASLAEDTSKKNSHKIEYYKDLLKTNIVLPSNLKTALIETNDFNIDRYYIREFEQSIVDEICKMKIVSEELSKKKINYPNTTLLYGPSGTGKTELVKYIAYKLNLPLFYVSFSSIIDSLMGSTAKNIHTIFEFCNSIPCVLMLDEIDCIAMKRSSGGSKGPDGEIERTTISIMQEFDRLSNNTILIAATNRLDIMDEALLRRFSIKCEIHNMTKDELYELGSQYLKSVDMDIDIHKIVYDSANPGELIPKIIQEIGKKLYEEKFKKGGDTL